LKVFAFVPDPKILKYTFFWGGGQRRSYTFYHKVSEKVKDKALKSLFAELAGEETTHREFLQGMVVKQVS
jgi:rubrerythrin